VEFPPFGENQKFMEVEMIELIYNKLPGCWKSWMSDAKYVPLKHSLDKLFNCMKHFEIANAFNPPAKQAQEMNDSNENENSKKKKVKCIIRSCLMMKIFWHANVVAYFTKN
jgi:hypothetical protein